ncbi:MAG: DUF3575 domain-containing protein [Chitinophagia bacterium]|nr:DUF3575 domain-containing protein [Chitinophagia bacterium]
MKKIILLLLALPLFTLAQEKTAPASLPKNIVRWNLSSLALSNFHFTYERALSRKVSVSLSYRFMIKGGIPFKSYFDDYLQSGDIRFNEISTSNNAFTPEIRFYLGKGNLKGFYLAPYLRFSSFNATTPINYSGGLKTGDFIGKVTATSGGIMLGWQFNLSKKWLFDFQIIGAHYGSCSGNLDMVSNIPLTSSDQTSLQSSLNGIKIEPFNISTSVNGGGANIKVSGPWGGIRGANIGIGFRF